MAKKKKKTARAEAAHPDWKTKWPRNGDLAIWFDYMLQKCDAMEDLAEASKKARLPIEHLAELGHQKKAIRWLNRFLKRLPRQATFEIAWTAELGAQICLQDGDLKKMEAYLAKAEATQTADDGSKNQRRASDSVRDFRADNGILEPDDAVDDDQRDRAEFWGAERRFRSALDARRKKQARQSVVEMEAVACRLKKRSRREGFLYFVVTGYAKLHDQDGVKRCIGRLDKHDRDLVLSATTLLELGMKREAIERSKNDIRSNLEKLATMTDPNIHFPAMSISGSLRLLHEQGETNVAKHWLRRTLREMQSWPALERGWSTSAVYHTLAEAVAAIDGIDAADQLIEQAARDGEIERRPGFKKAATSSAINLKADVGRLDEAIDEARRLRSPKQKRKELGKLFARAGRWKELRDVLCQVTSPEEAADVMWWIKFELPGGAID